MSNWWHRTAGVGAVCVALVAVPVGSAVPAWADGSISGTTVAPSAPATAGDAPAASAGAVDALAAPTTGAAPASTSVTDQSTAPNGPMRPKGCAGITPKKPWRLVAARPQPGAASVDIEWAAVGCTTGYRVDVVGLGVERHVDVAGGGTSSVSIADLPASRNYRITVTSIGESGDGGVSGVFRLYHSGPATRAELALDFPDHGPTEPVTAGAGGASPWSNPELTWTPSAGDAPASYRVKLTGGGDDLEKTVPGTTTSLRLGDGVSAGEPHTVTVTPVLADGTDGPVSRLTFGNQPAPRPEHVTGNAPVVQISPVTGLDQGRVLGYELAFGGAQTSKHVFIADPGAAGSPTPWVAVDPTFAVVDDAERAAPMTRMVATVRTITTLGKSLWTPAQTISYSNVATAEAAYFAGIGHLAGGDTAPRYGFLTVHGLSADVQVTDVVWSDGRRGRDVPVTVTVYGQGSGDPGLTQQLPITHLPDAAQDAWRASEIPLADGWTSIVLRHGDSEVARWLNTGAGACVASVTFADAPTELPDAWRDAWCGA